MRKGGWPIPDRDTEAWILEGLSYLEELVEVAFVVGAVMSDGERRAVLGDLPFMVIYEAIANSVIRLCEQGRLSFQDYGDRIPRGYTSRRAYCVPALDRIARI